MFWVVAKLPFGSIGFTKQTSLTASEIMIEFATTAPISIDQFMIWKNF